MIRRLLFSTNTLCRVYSSYSSSSSSSSSSGSSSLRPVQEQLSRWKRALSQIPSPPNIQSIDSGTKREVYVQALLGDKILGCAVMTTLMQQPNTENLDTGTITKVISSTVSNNFLAQQVDQILLPSWETLSLDNVSEWEIGTLVEFAISAVHKIDPTAVDDLAMFLLDIHTGTTETNTKSRLLELGGTFSSKRSGGRDHSPVFTAIAYLDSETATAQGPNKKRAEMQAAAQLLDSLGIEYDDSITPWRLPDEEVGPSYQTWEPFTIPATEVNLRGKETVEEWWTRGAFRRQKSIHRALLAPRIFPDVIEAVDCWVWRFDEEKGTAAFAIIVATNGECRTVPAVKAVSVNQVRGIVGSEVNQIIAELVGLKIPHHDS